MSKAMRLLRLFGLGKEPARLDIVYGQPLRCGTCNHQFLFGGGAGRCPECESMAWTEDMQPLHGNFKAVAPESTWLIESFGTLNVEKDDVVVIKTQQRLSIAQATNIAESIGSLLPHKNKVMMLDAGMDIGIVKKKAG